MSEFAVVAVVVRHSSTMKGNMLEWDVIIILRSVKSNRIESSSWPTVLAVERSSICIRKVASIIYSKAGRCAPGRLLMAMTHFTHLFIFDRGPSNGGVDIRSWIRRTDDIGSSVVRELRGVLCEERPRMIGILVGPRVRSFSSDAIRTALPYHINRSIPSSYNSS
ncbi:403_t:CDS:2 [Cetraspora pellucida]|uniref:403_t:CDS:1 n=1 Tax=Cetraspora pellucida TaxID=1433469 RepID=A0A9N9JCJ6_9GLOM|nr:403_t:CDS:2 [Cetraspora pellucida]